VCTSSGAPHDVGIVVDIGIGKEGVVFLEDVLVHEALDDFLGDPQRALVRRASDLVRLPVLDLDRQVFLVTIITVDKNEFLIIGIKMRDGG
jgi:hypothetical protein